MDAKISAPTRIEEILNEWDLDAMHAPVAEDYTASTADSYMSSLSNGTDTIALSNLFDSNISFSNSTTTGTTFSNTIWTTTGTGISAPWLTVSPNGPATTSTKINLDGENADIEVNGWSLVQAVKRIEERLDLFQPNPELEAEWAELRELGEQYRKLEQYIREKQATFDRLKAMPKIDVD